MNNLSNWIDLKILVFTGSVTAIIQMTEPANAWQTTMWVTAIIANLLRMGYWCYTTYKNHKTKE